MLPARRSAADGHRSPSVSRPRHGLLAAGIPAADLLNPLSGITSPIVRPRIPEIDGDGDYPPEVEAKLDPVGPDGLRLTLAAAGPSLARKASSSSDQGSAIEGFGQKIPLHDKLADLGMQLRHLGLAVRLNLKALVVEDLRQLLDRLSLPGCNLGRMQFVPGRQLGDRPLPWIASSATFALNSAVNRLRVLMVDLP